MPCRLYRKHFKEQNNQDNTNYPKAQTCSQCLGELYFFFQVIKQWWWFFFFVHVIPSAFSFLPIQVGIESSGWRQPIMEGYPDCLYGVFLHAQLCFFPNSHLLFKGHAQLHRTIWSNNRRHTGRSPMRRLQASGGNMFCKTQFLAQLRRDAEKPAQEHTPCGKYV